MNKLINATNSYKGQLKRQEKELKKKDKTINEMARKISELCTGLPVIIKQFQKEYCEFFTSDEDCCWKTNIECDDCIKKYFERKVEDAKN